MFWEYTFFCFVSLILTGILDLQILKTRICLQQKFWIFLVFIIIMQTIVDNWLNGRWWLDGYLVGRYNPAFYSNIKIWETPLENYFFGIALIWMNVSVYEFLKLRSLKKIIKSTN